MANTYSSRRDAERTLHFKGKIRILEMLLMDLAQQLVQQKATIAFGLSREQNATHLVEETEIALNLSINKVIEVTYTESYEPDINGLWSDATNAPTIQVRTPDYFAPIFDYPKELSDTEQILALKAPKDE
jgi:hypothetical protein